MEEERINDKYVESQSITRNCSLLYSPKMETSQFQNPNYNNESNYDAGVFDVDASEYVLSDYLIPEIIPEEDFSSSKSMAMTTTEFVSTGSSNPPIPTSSNIGTKNYCKMEQPTKSRVAFRIKSELDTLDDGFKWRKYGKKKVKTSPHPRNYYKCSSAGCGVKKRVEKDRENWSYVIVTYEGIHNHKNPSIIYYTHKMDPTICIPP